MRVSFDFEKISSALILIFGPPKMGGGPQAPRVPPLGSATVRVGEGLGGGVTGYAFCLVSALYESDFFLLMYNSH